MPNWFIARSSSPRRPSSPPCTPGMQSLEPSVHHFRKTGVIGDIDDGILLSASSRAVPPVEISSTSRRDQGAGEIHAMPVLSETLEQGTADGESGCWIHTGSIASMKELAETANSAIDAQTVSASDTGPKYRS